MKHLLSYIIATVFIGALLISCDRDIAPTANDNESLNSLNKVVANEYSYEVVLDGAIIENCATGELLTASGTAMVYYTEKTTPSGKTIDIGYTDYTYSPITLVGPTSGIWTLVKGQNHWHEVYKDFNLWPDPFFIQHYEWLEVYENANGEKIRISVQGFVKRYPNGDIEIARENSTCF